MAGPLNEQVSELVSGAVECAEHLLDGAEIPGVDCDPTLHTAGSGRSVLSVEESTAIMVWARDKLARAWLLGYKQAVQDAERVKTPAPVRRGRGK